MDVIVDILSLKMY